jgi:hypothetical protein
VGRSRQIKIKVMPEDNIEPWALTVKILVTEKLALL